MKTTRRSSPSRCSALKIKAGISLPDLAHPKTIIQQADHRVPEDIGRGAAHALITLINANDRNLPQIIRDTLVNGACFDRNDLTDRTLAL